MVYELLLLIPPWNVPSLLLDSISCHQESENIVMDSYYVGYLDNEEPHFLESCSLCCKTLSINSDIFMYSGDMAFCSQECRQEQIEYDEIKSKSWRKNSSSSRSSLRNSSDPKDSVAGETIRTKTLIMA
ncbi:PREDICTED: uncharacterized protein LOC109132983 [Camelina sativa]|uniref:Uncharacterized protein LOC109132983 n=1 Tax=Camelina sativa TaxID=90675 RepID=A0ABM1RPV5_CAMSA|nr:PREDICTED: uncharacterized protein LOC109132983 [Camelina sativa]